MKIKQSHSTNFITIDTFENITFLIFLFLATAKQLSKDIDYI